MGSDEDADGARLDEAVDELLGAPAADRAGAGGGEGGPDEAGEGPRLEEGVDELRGARGVDRGGADRAPLAPAGGGVVDVDVGAALVRDVAQPAVARAEEAAVRARE